MERPFPALISSDEESSLRHFDSPIEKALDAVEGGQGVPTAPKLRPPDGRGRLKGDKVLSPGK